MREKSPLEKFVSDHPKELRWVWYYEFSRELELDFTCRAKNHGGPNWFIPTDWRRFGSSLEKVAEWPKSSYTEISRDKRERYLEMWEPGGEQITKALLLRPQLPSNLDPSWLLAQLNDGFKRNGWPGFRWGGPPSDYLLIQLPHGATETSLRKAFGALLKSYPRATAAPRKKKAGQGSVPRTLKYDLKALDAYRDQVQRAALFPNSQQWDEAEARLAQVFRWFPMIEPPQNSTGFR